MARFRASAGVLAVQVLLLSPAAVALDLAQQPFTVRTFRQSDAVHAVGKEPDGMLWFGSRMGSDPVRRRAVLVRTRGPGVAIRVVHSVTWVRRLRASRDGSVWVAIGTGSLELMAGPPGSPPRPFAPHGADPGLVRAVALPARGRTPDRLQRFTAADGLPSPWVWALVEDPNGGMWVGSEERPGPVY